MQREQLYRELMSILCGEPDTVISGSFAVLMEYDEQQFATNPDWIPLANNANWEELCESYTEEQIRLMVDIIQSNKAKAITFKDRMMEYEIDRSYKMTTKNRKIRSDNREYVAKQLLLDKEKIIQSLLLHQAILYNPVVMHKGDITQCPSILKFTLGFIDKHEFLVKEYTGTSRHVTGCIVNLKKLKAIGYPSVTRADIIDVDLRHYTLAIWLLIQNNIFNW